jgi:PAS domain S-box-containing protein
MILADERGVIVYANPAAALSLGYRPEELRGRNGFDLCRPEHLPLARDAFARCLADPRQSVSLQVDARHSEGEFRTLVVRLLNRLGDTGVGVVVAHFRDATARALTSDPGRGPHEESYLFEKAPIGLGVADLEGNLLAFNDAILQPGGYTREDMLRIGNVSLLYATTADRERVLGIARQRGFVWREEVQFRRRDGSWYDTLLSLTPMRFRGRACWYATVEDITERKRAEAQRLQLEAQLRQAQKMEAVGRMTSGIAHDFNNVLSIIFANAELMASALGPEASELRQDLGALQAAAARGAAMIRKLLGFSRQAPLSIVPTNLTEVVQNVRGMLRHIVPEHITVDVRADEVCTAAVDPGAVEQMLMNLATNARDAMEGGGNLRIEVAPVTLDREAIVARSWMAPGDYVRISVADTGAGMDEETRARAFEPFFTTKPVGVGTGLGLPMVYGLVKQQLGFIDVESAPGQGTTVHVYFPKAADEATGGGAASDPLAQPVGGNETILLLEDDHSLRDTARRVLERLGYRVLVAADGVEGLALYRRHRHEIHLVISDMVMPGLTGPEVYEAIRRENAAVRFLLSSGYRERESVTGVPTNLPVFLKPWTIGEIARRVRQVLDRE